MRKEPVVTPLSTWLTRRFATSEAKRSDLARLTNQDRGVITMWCTGGQPVPLKHLPAISSLLETDFFKLLNLWLQSYYSELSEKWEQLGKYEELGQLTYGETQMILLARESGKQISMDDAQIKAFGKFLKSL